MSEIQAIQGFSTQPTCPNTMGAFLYETVSSYGSQVREQSSKAFENTVAFGNHYYQRLPSLTQVQGQMGEYKDALLNTTGTRFEQANVYARQKLADASEKMGEFGETIKGYGPTAREKLQQAGEYVRQNFPDLNDLQTVQMVAIGAVATTLALSAIYLSYQIYKINKEIEKDLQRMDVQYRELPSVSQVAAREETNRELALVTAKSDKPEDGILEVNASQLAAEQYPTSESSPQPWTWEVVVLSSDEANEFNEIFWQMQKECDQMFTNFGNSLASYAG